MQMVDTVLSAEMLRCMAACLPLLSDLQMLSSVENTVRTTLPREVSELVSLKKLRLDVVETFMQPPLAPLLESLTNLHALYINIDVHTNETQLYGLPITAYSSLTSLHLGIWQPQEYHKNEVHTLPTLRSFILVHLELPNVIPTSHMLKELLNHDNLPSLRVVELLYIHVMTMEDPEVLALFARALWTSLKLTTDYGYKRVVHAAPSTCNIVPTDCRQPKARAPASPPRHVCTDWISTLLH